MTKTKFKCNMQLDRARKTIAATVDELKGWEKKGIYTPGSEAWVINLQGLVALFHLNEGEGATAKNRAPVDAPIDGTITDGAWQDGPITKILTLNGTSANISLGAESQAGINLTSKLSLEVGFHPQLMTQRSGLSATKTANSPFIIMLTQGFLAAISSPALARTVILQMLV